MGTILQGCNNQSSSSSSGSNSSSITLYDGSALSCINYASGASLNDVLLAIANKVCNIDSRLTVVESNYVNNSTFTLLQNQVNDLDASDIDWTGATLGFLTVPANSNQEDVVVLIDAALSSLQSQITASAGIPQSLIELLNDYVISGGTYTQSLLNAAFVASEYVLDAVYSSLPAQNVLLVDNRDNYIDFNNGAYVVTDVAISAAPPPVIGMRLWLQRVQTGAFTTQTDFRNLYPLDGSDLPDEFLELRHITDSFIPDVKLTTTGVTAGTYTIPSITVNDRGRVTSISALANIASISNNDLLIYNSAGSIFQPGSISTLLPSTISNSFIFYDGANHINSPILRESGGNLGVNVVTPLESLEISGGIKVGNTANTNTGTIRWSGDHEGYDGTQWVSFTRMNNGQVLPNYVDAAAAVVGGLVSGDFFRTGEIVKQVP